MLFIDFSSAYNTVNRNILYKIIKNKKILENSELEFLKMMHQKLFFKC